MLEAGPDELAAPELEAGSLSSGKLFGFAREGLSNGSTVKKLAIWGGAAVLLGFLIPMSPDFEAHEPAWSLSDRASPVALLFPLLGIAMALTAAFAPLQAWQKSVTMMLAGGIGLATLPFIAGFASAPAKFLPGIFIGVLVCSWGLILRCLDAQSIWARRLTIAGALIGVAGYFIPMGNADLALPIELRFYLQQELGTEMPLSVYKAAFNRDPIVFFTSLYLLLPLVLLPLGALLSWRKPSGAWDKGGLLIRPVTWLATFYLPLGFALLFFNLLGYDADLIRVDRQIVSWDRFSTAAIGGRLKLFALSAGFSLWATLPVVAVHDHLVGKKA